MSLPSPQPSFVLAHTRLREVSGGGAPTPSGTCVWFG